MSVGTVTFHWASNYGAILQAYALQHFLKSRGLDTEIIDYRPLRPRLIRTVERLRHREMSEFIRERRMRQFRRRHLDVSGRTYVSRRQLGESAALYDAFICGSDQIWNEWFTLHAEGRPTLSYFLDFVAPEKPRIAYGASFGTDALTAAMSAVVRPELSEFRAIGVRESSGKEIVERLGLEATVVVDPTLLLSRVAYDGLIGDGKPAAAYPFFTYILHRDQGTAERLRAHIVQKYYASSRVSLYSSEPISVIDWLYHVRHADIVLTNSFHGVVFCTLFHTPFVAVPVEGVGASMNGRITTFLDAVGLSDRVAGRFDAEAVDALVDGEIDWAEVDRRIGEVRRASMGFLLGALQLPEQPAEAAGLDG